MNKILISKKISDEILVKYSNGISMRKLEQEYNYSFTFIQKLIKSNDFNEKLKVNYPIRDGYKMVAICKKTEKKFNDYSNESGAISKHLLNLYPDINKLSKYKRKSIEYETGKFWFDDYFTFSYEKENDLKKCYYCDWLTEDINNCSGAYEKHLLSVHNKKVNEYLIDNPTDIAYFKNLEPTDGVVCKICNKKFRILNHKHLRTHNISVMEYKLKYDDYDIVSDSTKLKLNNNWDINLKFSGFKKQSSYEKLIIDELSSVDLIESDRTILDGLELDLYSEDMMIGIEVNGVYYHGEMNGRKDKNYHLNKTIECNRKNVRLIQIFEDEIYYKKNIVISKLKHIFNVSNNEIIHARKCVIKEISNTDSMIFLNKYHIQGGNNYANPIGAYYNDNLVAVMCFDNKRNLNKDSKHNGDTYELTRFAVINGFNINGIASRLLKFFIEIKKPQRIISFADRRWTLSKDNNLYTKLGFDLVKILKPDYSYVNSRFSRYNRLHKFGFGKSSLKKRFPENYDVNKTEWEIMQEVGFDRIWDCGKFKYELIVNKKR